MCNSKNPKLRFYIEYIYQSIDENWSIMPLYHTKLEYCAYILGAWMKLKMSYTHDVMY